MTKRKRRQFTPEFRADAITLARASGIICSLSRQGDCWDNPVAESFFSPLKSDLTLDDPDLTPELARALLLNHIGNVYNPETNHSTLDDVSPIGYGLKLIVPQQSTHMTRVST